MSVYNGNILTRIIDPVYDSANFKTEFRLNSPDVAYLSNLRLIDMGINATPVNSYDYVNGAFCMESIQLYDGNVLLDQVLKATIWNSWNAINTTNDVNMSIESVTRKNGLGYLSQGRYTYDGVTNKLDRNSTQVSAYPSRADSEQTDEKAWFDLKSFLPFLQNMMVLSTKTFKNLRLVINWKSGADLKNLVQDRSGAESTYEDTALIVDMIQDPSQVDAMTRAYKGHTWLAVESDQIYVNPIVPPADSELEVTSRVLVNGFNNKTLEKLNVVQTPLNQATWVNGNDTLWGANHTSVSQYKSKFQFRINGSNKLPRDGYTKKNQRLAQLTETYGEINLYPTQNFTYVPVMTQQLEESSSQGKVDYTGIDIKERVNEFQLTYVRTGVAGNDDLNQALNLNLFGEVRKSLEIMGDKYRIFYS